jgi:hypothetical protein
VRASNLDAELYQVLRNILRIDLIFKISNSPHPIELIAELFRKIVNDHSSKGLI